MDHHFLGHGKVRWGLDNKCVKGLFFYQKNEERGTALERIAYGEVEAKGIPEAAHIVVAALAGIVGRMDTDSYIESEDEEVKVVAQAGACAEGDILEELAGVDGSTRTGRIGLHEPGITCIEEDGPFEVAHDGETVFSVEFELDVTDLIDITPLRVRWMVAARTYRSNAKSTNTVSTSHIEEVGIRCHRRVAVAPYGSEEGTGSNIAACGDGEGVAVLGRELQILSKGHSKEVLIAFFQGSSAKAIDGVDDITGFLGGEDEGR